jgi:hypothetical protein
VLASIALIVAACLQPSWAEDFVINVPVDVQDMDSSVRQVQVSCYVHAAEAGEGEHLGMGVAAVPMPDSGAFTGVVRVAIDVLPDKDAQRARGYVCTLMFPNGLSMEAERDRGTPGAQSKPGTLPVLQIRGSLPRREARQQP